MAQMINNSKNPAQYMQLLGAQNPQIGQIMRMINARGITPKQMFYQTAQSMGIDPESFISALQ
jgi:hypothetical protein